MRPAPLRPQQRVGGAGDEELDVGATLDQHSPGGGVRCRRLGADSGRRIARRGNVRAQRVDQLVRADRLAQQVVRRRARAAAPRPRPSARRAAGRSIEPRRSGVRAVRASRRRARSPPRPDRGARASAWATVRARTVANPARADDEPEQTQQIVVLGDKQAPSGSASVPPSPRLPAPPRLAESEHWFDP